MLLFACLALHPIHDLHLHAVDIQKQASAIVANQDQHYFWLSETDITRFCRILPDAMDKSKTSHDTKLVIKSPRSKDILLTSQVLHLTKQLRKDSKASPQTIYQDDILTQSTHLCITTPRRVSNNQTCI